MTRRVVPNGWPGDLTKAVGRQVRRYRSERGLSAEKLAQAVTELGYDYTRAQVTNLEAERRESLTVAELMALARCLDVPPLLLLFAPDEPEIETLPGQRSTPSDAAAWFTGEQNAAMLLAEYRRTLAVLATL